MDHDLVLCFLHLAEADDIRRKTRYVVHSGECLMAVDLVLDQDSASAIYVCDGAISKTHRTMDPEINLREQCLHARHMVGCP
jgi:hypothetical protein